MMSTQNVNSIDEPDCFAAKLTALRTAIDEGDASGIAEGNVFQRVRETLNLHARPR